MEAYCQINVTCRKELYQLVTELRKKGIRVSSAFGLILGRWTESFPTTKEAVQATMALFDDFNGPEPVGEFNEFEKKEGS